MEEVDETEHAVVQVFQLKSLETALLLALGAANPNFLHKVIFFLTLKDTLIVRLKRREGTVCLSFQVSPSLSLKRAGFTQAE